jgi:hypothetical protein
MRVIPPALVGLVILLAVPAQAVPTPKDEIWRPLPSRSLSLNLGDQGCGEGFHEARWRDWRGEWWWGPCVPNR